MRNGMLRLNGQGSRLNYIHNMQVDISESNSREPGAGSDNVTYFCSSPPEGV